MMVEVIQKLFYIYYFWFDQPYGPAMLKNQNQKYVVRMRRFFLWSVVNKECRWNL